METSVVVSGALFSGEGKVLLLRPRASEEWEFPGNALEFGEPPELGLIRIFNDITGLEVSVDRPLGAWSVLEENRHMVHIDYTVQLSGVLTGIDLEPERYSKFGWFNRPDVLSLPLITPVRSAVERAFGMLARSRKNG